MEYNNTKLMSEYYKDDGSVAKIYQVVTGMDGEHSFFSITYKDPAGNQNYARRFSIQSFRLCGRCSRELDIGYQIIKGLNMADFDFGFTLVDEDELDVAKQGNGIYSYS